MTPVICIYYSRKEPRALPKVMEKSMWQTPGCDRSKDYTALPQSGRVYETKKLNSLAVTSGVQLEEGGNYNIGLTTAKQTGNECTRVNLDVLILLVFFISKMSICRSMIW